MKIQTKLLWQSAALAALVVAASGIGPADAAKSALTGDFGTPATVRAFTPDSALIARVAPAAVKPRLVQVADRADDEGVSWGTDGSWSTSWGGGWGASKAERDKATTKTFIAEERTFKPMLGADSSRNLARAISLYQEIVNQGGWPKLTVHGRALQVGAKGRQVELLRRRLEISGDIDPGTAAKRDEFGPDLKQGVQRFQARHGLKVDGVVATDTLEQLNVSANERLETLKVNVNRTKRLAENLGSKYVIVNVPAAQAETVQNGYVYSRHNVIAGQKSRPTPLVASSIYELNFNPYWHVPVSIIEKDLLPELRKSTKLLDRMNMRIYKGGYNGEEIDPRSVDWSTVKASDYQFRQDPGAQNAMASVKINFRNSHAVFLHDTPTKQLFGQGDRFLSSGCVRVQGIQVMLEWLLKENQGWDGKRIGQMAESEQRDDVNLKDPAQIRLAYLTAWADSDGSVNFREDLYDWDKEYGGEEPIDFNGGAVQTSQAKAKSASPISELAIGDGRARQRAARAATAKPAADDALAGLESDAEQLGQFR